MFRKINHSSHYYAIWICITIIICLVVPATFETVEMRIVDEPTAYSWQQNANMNTDASLKMRVNPSPFSGPEHLRRLSKKCFKKTLEKYEYEFCPFGNVTQKEVGTNSWNTFYGILGVWQEWKIVDNQFHSMKMFMGEQCGVTPREIEVKLRCGKQDDIIEVTEPSHCNYEMIFSTPLTCHNHSMLVYPTLSKQLQSEWDQLLSDFTDEQITEKGYKKALNALFKTAGYVRTSESESEVEHKEEKVDKEENLVPSNSRFSSLSACSQAYEELKEELEQTKTQLARFL